ncbi:hypothetical protein E5P55_01325 [Candidatus Pinguicoccus supinus]|uniref:Aminoacyl-tRNA synthetase class Ia domain-containing protein n=1 Tax=Candidatus Pinguicoccus supinus TaxID=2529394 RepID=A0A7T0FY64_9BACT|nr:hypothetical protein E5P55_01325 [Candidatus Pinguicoccus supinus]
MKFILKNETPYKKIFTHGFITNRYSEKFSKSTSNVNKFSLFIQTYGSELFRL